MAEKKNCVGCKRGIPVGAHNCVFCGAKQPVAELKLTAFLSTIRDDGGAPPEAARPGESVAAAGGSAAAAVMAQPEPPPTAIAPVAAQVAAVEAVPSSVVSDVGPIGTSGRRASTGTANHRSQTENTVMNLEGAAKKAMEMVRQKSQESQAGAEGGAVLDLRPAAANNAETEAPIALVASPGATRPPSSPSALRATAAMIAVVDDSSAAPAVAIKSDAARSAAERKADAARRAAQEAAAEAAERAATSRRAPLSFQSIVRAVMIVAGAALLVLFAKNAPLLGALGGNQLVLAYYQLVGGLLLAAGGLLPLPGKVRAAVAALAGAVPLFVAPPLVELDGWRGLAAALLILLLPGALVLRQRVTGSLLSRALVVGAVGVAFLIYLVPVGGVVPLKAALGLFATGQINEIVSGAITLLPLLLVAGTLTALLPSSSSGFGVGWAVLLLLAVSGSVVLAGHGDQSLFQLGVAILAAGSAAAVGVAQLLDVEGQSA